MSWAAPHSAGNGAQASFVHPFLRPYRLLGTIEAEWDATERITARKEHGIQEGNTRNTRNTRKTPSWNAAFLVFFGIIDYRLLSVPIVPMTCPPLRRTSSLAYPGPCPHENLCIEVCTSPQIFPNIPFPFPFLVVRLLQAWTGLDVIVDFGQMFVSESLDNVCV